MSVTYKNLILAAAVNFLFALSATVCAQQVEPIAAGFDKKIVKSSWMYRVIAENTVFLTSAASKAQGENKRELIKKSAEQIRYLIDSMEPDGTWWNPSRKIDGDPNVNRFVLAPLLDAITIAERIEDYPREILYWKSQALIAAEFQYEAYHGRVPWDLGAAIFKKYPNQDVYYLLICALAKNISQSEKFQHDEQEALEGLENQLMPSGGWHYVGEETESPVYHYITEIILSRYYEITKSARALAILKSSVKYWDQILSDNGQPSYTADPWWKQFWQPIPKSAVQLAERISKSKKLSAILKIDNKYFSKESGVSGAYISEWINPSFEEINFLKSPHGFFFDADAKRYFSEENSIYTDLVEGRGLRNTFVGIRYCNLKSATFCSTMRAVTPKIKTTEKTSKTLFLSAPEDDGAFKEGLHGVAYAIKYKIHPAVINSTPKPKSIDTPFMAQQIWYAKSDGITGVVSISAARAMETELSLISTTLGPDQIIYDPSTDTYKSGELIVKFFSSFGGSAIEPEQRIQPSVWPKWNSIQQGFGEQKFWNVGDEQNIIVWVGHDLVNAPKSVVYSPEAATLQATYSNISIKISHIKEFNYLKLTESESH